jgi:hypothetical protein
MIQAVSNYPIFADSLTDVETNLNLSFQWGKRGNLTMKELPFPNSLSTLISP